MGRSVSMSSVVVEVEGIIPIVKRRESECFGRGGAKET